MRADIGNVQRAVLEHPPVIWLIDTVLRAGNSYGTKMSPCRHHLALAESQHYVINTANPHGALDDRIQYRLHIGGRAADNTKHLGGCRLMLQCLAQFCVALAEFFE